jgi:hypothetical protein
VRPTLLQLAPTLLDGDSAWLKVEGEESLVRALEAFRKQVWLRRFDVRTRSPAAGISGHGDLNPLWANAQALIAAGEEARRLFGLGAQHLATSAPSSCSVAISAVAPQTLATAAEAKALAHASAAVSWHCVSAATEAALAIGHAPAPAAANEEWERQRADIDALAG